LKDRALFPTQRNDTFEVIDVYANYPDLIIIHGIHLLMLYQLSYLGSGIHLLKYHIVPYKYVKVKERAGDVAQQNCAFLNPQASLNTSP
jgi:hypothetical protein